MVWLPNGKKIVDMFSDVDRIPACVTRTEGHKDRLTDILTLETA